MFNRLGRHRLNVGASHYVSLDEQGLTARCLNLAQDLLAPVATARSDSDLRAFLGEQKRRGRTEP
jgi:hypothetical protein